MSPKKPHPEESTRLVKQRYPGDCGVAALAGYLSRDYKTVAQAAREVVPDFERHGMTDRQLLRIARRLGNPLRKARRWSLLDAVGIADVELKGKTVGHFTVLNRGLILDGDEAIPVDTYLERERAAIEALYVLKG